MLLFFQVYSLSLFTFYTFTASSLTLAKNHVVSWGLLLNNKASHFLLMT